MLTTREKVLILILMLLASLGGLWQYYLVPTTETLNRTELQLVQLQNDLGAAETRSIQYQMLQARISQGLEREWEETIANVPQYFEPTEMLRLIQDVVYPHAYDPDPISATFAEPQERGSFTTTATTISFNAYRAGLEAVINAFAGDNMPTNRIVTYTVTAMDADYYALFGPLAITIVVDFLTVEGLALAE